MSDYQVIARKFRPQSFHDVFGQEAIITTLKNAIKYNKLAHAYLFCGSRGTGKTTLARLLAKALNCEHLTDDFEPCNHCQSCKEITAGCSLDVLEIDGASHRGIDDVRQINETVGYSSTAKYKIYIIDEVHMLTKDAFNALLKTLEEPPAHVKFFFATTEAHKVLPTIVSRCQRFQLNRIPLEKIEEKLRSIGQSLGVKVEEEAFTLIAQRAEGGLRDAESLFDQIIAFEEGTITVASVNSILGLMPREIYFEIDRAGKKGEFSKAFEIIDKIFSEGKNFTYFIEGLIDHLRKIILFKLSDPRSLIGLNVKEKEQFIESAALYSQEQCLDLIDYLLESQDRLRFSSFGKITLEAILLHVMRSHFRIPIEQLVRRLGELEKMITKMPAPIPVQINPSSQISSAPVNVEAPLPTKPVVQKQERPIQEDPTPTAADLGKKRQPVKQEPIIPLEPMKVMEESHIKERPMHAYDTLFHFASVELEGKLQKN
jgi:DNA polymerase-3 subunit gamma/tau